MVVLVDTEKTSDLKKSTENFNNNYEDFFSKLIIELISLD